MKKQYDDCLCHRLLPYLVFLIVIFLTLFQIGVSAMDNSEITLGSNQINFVGSICDSAQTTYVHDGLSLQSVIGMEITEITINPHPQSIGRSITFLLYEKTNKATNFVLRAIGDTVRIDSVGMQSHPFKKDGSSKERVIVNGNYVIGWKDGSVLASNLGVISFDVMGGVDWTHALTFNSAAALSGIGSVQIFGNRGLGPRSYRISVKFRTKSTVPLSLQLNNQGYVVDYASNLRLIGSSFTILMWVNIEEFSNDPQGTPLLADGNAGDLTNNRALHLMILGQRPYIDFFGSGTMASSPLQAKVWYHLGFVYDAPSRTQLIYINSELVGSSGNHDPLQGNGQMFLGQYGGGFGRLHGRIGQLKIFPSAVAVNAIEESMFQILPNVLSLRNVASQWQDITPSTVKLMAIADDSLDQEIQKLNLNVFPITLQMNNQGYFINYAASLGLIGSSFSVLMWVNIDEFTNNPQGTPLFAPANYGDLEPNRALHLVIREKHPVFAFYASDSTASYAMQEKVWYHLGFVYDAPSRTQLIYVNGELVGSSENHEPLQGNARMYLGQYAGGPVTLRGRIGQVKIYPSIVSATELKDSMFQVLPGLVNLKNIAMNQWSDLTPRDILPLCARDRTLDIAAQRQQFNQNTNNNPASSVSFPRTLQLNNEAYIIDLASNLLLLGNSFSVLMWVKIDQFDNGPQGTPLFAPDNSGSFESRQSLALKIRGRQPYFGMDKSDCTSVFPLQERVWYHLGFVYDVFARTQHIYVNGELTQSAENRSPLQLDGRMTLGGYGIHGRIGQLKVYPMSLAPSDIYESMFQILPSLINVKQGAMNQWRDATPSAAKASSAADASLSLELQSRKSPDRSSSSSSSNSDTNNHHPVPSAAVIDSILGPLVAIGVVLLLVFLLALFLGRKAFLQGLVMFSGCVLRLFRYVRKGKEKKIRLVVEADEAEDEEDDGTELVSFTANNDRQARDALSSSSLKSSMRRINKEDLEEIRSTMNELNHEKYYEIMSDAGNRNLLFQRFKKNPALSQEFLLYPENYRLSYLRSILNEERGLPAGQGNVAPNPHQSSSVIESGRISSSITDGNNNGVVLPVGVVVLSDTEMR